MHKKITVAVVDLVHVPMPFEKHRGANLSFNIKVATNWVWTSPPREGADTWRRPGD